MDKSSCVLNVDEVEQQAFLWIWTYVYKLFIHLAGDFSLETPTAVCWCLSLILDSFQGHPSSADARWADGMSRVLGKYTSESWTYTCFIVLLYSSKPLLINKISFLLLL